MAAAIVIINFFWLFMVAQNPAKYLVRVAQRQQLSAVAGKRDSIFSVTLRFEENYPFFAPGDSLLLWPKNPLILVDLMLESLGLEGGEIVFSILEQGQKTFRQALTDDCNLLLISNNLRLLLGLSLEEAKSGQPLFWKDRLAALKLPAQSWMELLAPMRPRYYSIASARDTQTSTIELLVELVSKQDDSPFPFGLASYFLCQSEAALRSSFLARVHSAPHFHLLEDGATPIIMVGSGTGVAPFKAFVQERARDSSAGEAWLFFGSRHQESEFFYRDFWEAEVGADRLRLSTAFSRDQPEKIYVTDRIWDEHADFLAWIVEKRAMLYVCGSAKKLKKGIEEILIRLTPLASSNMGGVNLLTWLKQEKRLCFDVY